ncbi:hypothetical protein GCM10010988_22920 [Cnuibacter physcomitrellae]|uniref:Uncharacterized protein n=1 Tax=Cnuibacter physcomitrellae TaxID=1619308 RepID=A0A1X9LP43_9MICO|nr:hypothetical protein [Cnuibacter physcomitrellae]ARJ06953.1 hypothetical protein B5808_18260 [Cnuibacter physcomitrellae]GGI39208.1 hypothetical protein GCM10010988_22920 [Cnuibacter physcomitrellae]
MADTDSIDHAPISEDAREAVRAKRTRGALIAGAVGFGLMGAGGVALGDGLSLVAAAYVSSFDPTGFQPPPGVTVTVEIPQIEADPLVGVVIAAVGLIAVLAGFISSVVILGLADVDRRGAVTWAGIGIGAALLAAARIALSTVAQWFGLGSAKLTANVLVTVAAALVLSVVVGAVIWLRLARRLTTM